MPRTVKLILAQIGLFTGVVIALLESFHGVHWTAAQTTLVTAEAGSIIALATALIAHFWPATKQEPVAVAGGLTAFVTATITLGTGFLWWTLTADQLAALVSGASAVIGLGSALVARNAVTAETSKPAR